ncbi:MAG: type II toxin-antitoxin system PemK/MazF family toxin [Solirubrobacterales bacterium]
MRLESGGAAVGLSAALTSSAPGYPFQVSLPCGDTGLREDSKAQAEQVRSISVERLGEAVGIVPSALLESVDDALRLHLALG